MPDSIGNLENLTSLYLNANNLKIVPESIGGLKNLTSLNLRGNDLKWLPESIKKLASTLKELDLKENPVWNNQKEMKTIKSWLPNTEIKW